MKHEIREPARGTFRPFELVLSIETKEDFEFVHDKILLAIVGVKERSIAGRVITPDQLNYVNRMIGDFYQRGSVV